MSFNFLGQTETNLLMICIYKQLKKLESSVVRNGKIGSYNILTRRPLFISVSISPPVLTVLKFIVHR